MITVHKKTFHVLDIGKDDKIHFELPAFSEILTVAEQVAGTGEIAIWYRCKADNQPTPRFLHVIGTGNPAPMTCDAPYIATVLLHGGRLVLHFFGDGREF